MAALVSLSGELMALDTCDPQHGLGGDFFFFLTFMIHFIPKLHSEVGTVPIL